MKNILLTFTLLVISIVGLQAQTPQTTTTPAVVITSTQSQPSAEDIKKAKETIQELLNSDIQTSKQSQATSQTKNVADVMEKGLDVLSGYVATLEGVVSKFAPEICRIMILQQYSKAIGYPLFWGLMLLSVFIIYKILRSWWGLSKDSNTMQQQTDEDDDGYVFRVFLSIVLLICGGVFSVFFLNALSDSVMIAINPEYYALKDIIQLLR